MSNGKEGQYGWDRAAKRKRGAKGRGGINLRGKGTQGDGGGRYLR